MATIARRARRWLVWGALLLLAAWCTLVEPRWVAMREIEHAVPQWQGPPGLKVAVASDWHFSPSALGGVMTPARARDIVDAINASAPDVVLLPGDFISEADWPPGSAPEAAIAAELGRLRAPLGVFAVLGNHDWWYDGAALARALRARGITVLENEAKAVNAGLWVVGIGDHSTEHAQPARALAAVPARAQVLVLMHDPLSVRGLPPLQGLVVAGHTHGGQVALPGIGPLWLPNGVPRDWAHGWVEQGGNRMYVTSGLGVSILPLRLGARPEWVLFRIGGALG